MWEWAVFASLCVIHQDDEGSFNERVSKGGRAKELVLRHYAKGQAESITRRLFLEANGVPRQWFEEALAFRYGYEGHVIQCINHMSEWDSLKASRLLERYVLPSSFFSGTKRELADVARVFPDSDHYSLVVALKRIFCAESSLLSVSGTGSEREEQTLQSIRSELDDLESFLLERQSRCRLVDQMPPLLPPVPAAPMSALLRACSKRLDVIKSRTRPLLLQDAIRGKY
jgi:hypothetical protein